MFGLMLEPVEKAILPYCGRAVMVLMKDGSRKIGQLTSCSSGRLVLNGEEESGEEAFVSRKARIRRTSRRRTRKSRIDPAPQPAESWDGLSLAPLGPEPPSPYPMFPRESVPLKAVESILLL
ncbi:hypothetical protein [Cohnella caldifontis]|uniref:hypothetical protein n=1 Tax=Cohnella caldifontis TaxID=3027471 RepID=UPI0023EAC1CD|nr:hypothetical protein [Cohnella sp. YIM B05605]